MIIRLDHNTNHAKWEMLDEFQEYAIHDSVMIVLHFDGTSSV